MAAALARAIERKLGEPVRIEWLEAVSGGASAQTWRFDLVVAGESRPLIAQTAAGESRFPGALDKARQAAVQQVAARNGVATPRVCWTLAPEDGLGWGYIAERVEGETLGKRIVGAPEFAAAREVMPAQCGDILAQIHRIDTRVLPELEALSPGALVERLAREHHSYGEPLPVFELAIRWLQDHLPASETGVLVHGDFRLGNLIVHSKGIAAVLDWELAHVGDPMEDLGWLCLTAWRFGQIDKPVGGFGSRHELYRAYEKASGRTVHERSVHFWEVYGTLKWGVVCQFLAFQQLRGDVRSLERAAIGRRVSETELDLIELIESGGR